MTWAKEKLGQFCDIQNGYAFDSKLFTEYEGMQLIRIRDISDGVNTVINYSGEYDPKYLVNAGDFLIGMDGEFRCHEWKGKASLLNQRVCKLHSFRDYMFPRFIFHGINKYLKDIEDVTSFTTVKHISAKQIKDIVFPRPPIEEQKRIVAILDEAFEQIDQAKANAEQNLKNAREVFNSYLANLSSKKIKLGELVRIVTGKLDANAAIENGQYPFFTCAREIFAIDNFAFDFEAILLAGNNAVGDFNVKHYKGKFNAYQRTYVITINDEDTVLYRFLYYQLVKSLKQFKKQSVGAGTKFLKIGMIKELEISLPDIAEQRTIVQILDDLQEQTLSLENVYQKKIQALDELKQSLLQKAFSGELTNSADGDAA